MHLKAASCIVSGVDDTRLMRQASWSKPHADRKFVLPSKLLECLDDDPAGPIERGIRSAEQRALNFMWCQCAGVDLNALDGANPAFCAVRVSDFDLASADKLVLAGAVRNL